MPRAKLLLLSLFLGIAASSIVLTGSAATPLLPDLRPLPARDVNIILSGSQKLLRFTTTTTNEGAGALELRPGPVDTGSGKQQLLQRIYNNDGTFTEVALNTWMEWHAAHNHFHVNDYAVYSLQSAGAPGQSLTTGAKTTFCIIDTDRINTKLPGAPKRPVYTSCGTDRQGMSVGWGDSYGYTLAGQYLDITGLPDGDYILTIQVDPKGHFSESDASDNTSTVSIRITGNSVDVIGGGGGRPR